MALNDWRSRTESGSTGLACIRAVKDRQDTCPHLSRAKTCAVGMGTQRLGLPTVGIETVCRPVPLPALIEFPEFGFGDDPAVSQGQQGGSDGDPRDVRARYPAALGASHPRRFDPSFLPDAPAFRRHTLAQVGELLPRHRPRPSPLEFREHLGKPHSLGITGRHQPQSSHLRLSSHFSAEEIVCEALGLIV